MVASGRSRSVEGGTIAEIALAIHGGAGAHTRERSTPERDRLRRQVLRDSLVAGLACLSGGAPALDAVEAAVRVLEDCYLFNAGVGSHLNARDEVEMDAAVMDGRDARAGAVAVVRFVRNPISAARAVLDDGRQVLLAGPDADAFAGERGVQRIDPAELVAAAERRAQRDATGTVGAVARDALGHLAVATSTGGRRRKHPGRVGDSPLIGAGSWADDATCAVSGTGDGELFVRSAFAHAVHARVRYAGAELERACLDALERVRELGGSGGCIAVAPAGPPVLVCTTRGMPRGTITSDDDAQVAIYADEELS